MQGSELLVWEAVYCYWKPLYLHLQNCIQVLLYIPYEKGDATPYTHCSKRTNCNYKPSMWAWIYEPILEA